MRTTRMTRNQRDRVPQSIWAFSDDSGGTNPPSGNIPANAYVAEDGTTPYVAEDGVTYYVTEA